MKEAEEKGKSPTVSELKTAFQKAEKKGAIVGGPLMSDEKSN